LIKVQNIIKVARNTEWKPNNNKKFPVENDNNLTIAQVLTNAEKTIQQALVKHSLKTSDLDSKFAD